ncbi:hypothetical protein ACVILE_003068 [Streptomyces sp. M18.1]
MEKPRSVSVPRHASAARRDPVQFRVGEVSHAPYAGLVTGALDALDHLAHVAHRAAGQGEIRYVHHRLVAEFEGVEPGLAGPDLAAGLGAAHDGRGPGVGAGLVHEAFDGARPRLHVTDRVAAGQHHAGDDAVGDGGLAAGGEDDGLVAAEREVAEGVPAAVPGEQGAQPGLVVLGETGRRVLGAEGQVDGGDSGQQAEGAEGEGDRPGGVAAVVDRALDAEEAVQDVRDAVGQARVADHAVRVGVDHQQSEGEGAGGHEDEVGQRPPAAARVGERRELVAVAQQGREQGEGDDYAEQGVAVGELGDGAEGEQGHGRSPGPALAALEAVGEQEEQDAGAEGEGRGEGTEGAGEHLGEGVHAAVPEAGEDAGGDVEQAHECAGPADEEGDVLRTGAAQYAS